MRRLTKQEIRQALAECITTQKCRRCILKNEILCKNTLLQNIASDSYPEIFGHLSNQCRREVKNVSSNIRNEG